MIGRVLVARRAAVAAILLAGLAGCGTQTPDLARAATTAQAPTTPQRPGAPTADPPTTSSAACLIKGNISSSGERIYHVPGQQDYAKTVISESKGERWFCTEEQAVAAGWRKAKR